MLVTRLPIVYVAALFFLLGSYRNVQVFRPELLVFRKGVQQGKMSSTWCTKIYFAFPDFVQPF